MSRTDAISHSSDRHIRYRLPRFCFMNETFFKQSLDLRLVSGNLNDLTCFDGVKDMGFLGSTWTLCPGMLAGIGV